MTQQDVQTIREAGSTTATGVVVGVDDSASARAAVAWAAAAAGRRGVALHLVEVLPGPVSPASEGTSPGVPHGRARALLCRARDIALATSSGLTVSMHTLSGRVGPALVEYAAEASLLVLGSNGPGGPIPLSLGSVLGEATRRCSCPVVLVPPAARRRVPPEEGPVLVALEDGPDGERALDFAADVAAWRAVPLTVLVGPGGESATDPAPLARLRERRPDLSVRTRTVTSPADALLAADAHAALLVVPPEPRRASREHPVAGWTGHFLPVLSTCPVAVVSSHTRPSAALA